MRRPCPDGATLLAFVDGRMSSDDMKQVEAHLDECSDCRDEIGFMRRLTDALGSMKDQAVSAAEAKSDGRAAESCDAAFDPAPYLDGGLDQPSRMRYERHVAECSMCLRELSDFIAARRPDAPLPSDDAIAEGLARVRRERSRIVLRVTEGVLRYVDGWIASARDFVVGTGFEGREPALAGVRSQAAPVTFRWECDGGYVFDCEVSGGVGDSEIVGRVLRHGVAAVDVSVALRGSELRGPDSVDSEGRFGPWQLGTGLCELRFEALRLPGGSLSLTLDIADESGEVQRKGATSPR